MIGLDTNYLILALVSGSAESERLFQWREAGERLFASATVWYEFVCGPVQERQVAAVRALLHEVVPFDESQAHEAARLYNACGRKRHLRVDAMIAAAATSRRAPLATSNLEDFRAFEAAGLRLLV